MKTRKARETEREPVVEDQRTSKNRRNRRKISGESTATGTGEPVEEVETKTPTMEI